jgi:hypothetical protein
MKFSHALILASSLAFFACGGDDDDDSPAGPSKNSYDCSVSEATGVKVVYPAGGETFKIGETIDVIFGVAVEDNGYRIIFKKNAGDQGIDLLDEPYDLNGSADGKTCYTAKVKLDAESVEATMTGAIRVAPYNKQNKGNNSGFFIVKE